MSTSRSKHWPGDGTVNPAKIIWSKAKTVLG
jgi:hypothetical protein